jgi:hypothetical protein
LKWSYHLGGSDQPLKGSQQEAATYFFHYQNYFQKSHCGRITSFLRLEQEIRSTLMTTELIDANTQQATPPAMLNAQDFAEALSIQLAKNFKQAETPKQQADEIAEVVAQLQAAGIDSTDIQAHISTALGLDKKLARVVKETEEKATKQIFQTMQQKELANSIGRIIRSYSRDDELVQLSTAAIRENTYSEFLNSNNPQVVITRQRFLNNGDLDEDVLDEIIARQIKKLDSAVEKRTGKKKEATPNIKPSDTTARPNPVTEAPALSVEEMTPVQDAVYNAHRSQMLRLGRSKEEADKLARVAATRVKK